MPILKSSKKQMRQNAVRRVRNEITKKKFREIAKKFVKLIAEKKIDDAKKIFPSLQKSIDLAAKKNILHKNNAARKISKFAKLLK